MARGKWLTPDSTGDSMVARCLNIPLSILPHVNGALETLRFSQNWEEQGDMSIEDTITLVEDMLIAYYESEGCGMADTPREFFALWAQGQIISGTAQIFSVLATQEYNGYWEQSTPAINDNIEFTAMLEEGTYDLTVLYRKSASNGIQHWLIDGVEDSQTIDCYSSSAVQNVETTISVQVVGSGLHTIQCKMSTKNASSSNYRNMVTYFKMHRTGD